MTVAVILITACDNELDKSQFMYQPKPIPVTGVKLDKNAITLSTGSNASPVATIAPARASNQNIAWTTSNATVATVTDAGKISALTVGKAMITATTADGSFTDTCSVTVVLGFPVTDVELAPSDTTINVGDKTDPLRYKIAPDNATDKFVKWSSSDVTIATVDESGKVTAVGPGVATITVTTEDGDFTATSNVTVIQPVMGVKLSKTSIGLKMGQAAVLLTDTVLPKNATDQTVKWSISGEGVSMTVNAGANGVSLVRTGPGTATVTVTTNDGGFTASCVVTEFYPNELAVPFAATLNDNFVYLDSTLLNGYSGKIALGSKMFDSANGGAIAKGDKFQFDITFTTSRDLESSKLHALLVDNTETATPNPWWSVKGDVILTGDTIKADVPVTLSITITTTAAATNAACDLFFEIPGEGTAGVAGSGKMKAVTFNFTKFTVNKLDE